MYEISAYLQNVKINCRLLIRYEIINLLLKMLGALHQLYSKVYWGPLWNWSTEVLSLYPLGPVLVANFCPSRKKVFSFLFFSFVWSFVISFSIHISFSTFTPLPLRELPLREPSILQIQIIFNLALSDWCYQGFTP